MSKQKKHKANRRETRQMEDELRTYRCTVCDTPLIDKGGCGDTGMCGPCCLGEADTVGMY